MDAQRLAEVEQQLRSPALNLRVAAVNLLAQLDSGVAVPVLARLAEDPDFLYRRMAVMGLGNHPVAASLEVLESLLLAEEDSNVVAEAANSLMEFGEAGVLRLAKLFRENDNWLVRQTVLGVMMDGDRSSTLLDVVRLGLGDPVVTTRETAILALGKFVDTAFQAEAIDLLLEMAVSSQWRDRWRSATALCRFGDDRAKAMLGRLRSDGSHYVVAAALESGYD
ncbi:MAG: HEAT repeat domain-containing protein [Alkalinema sp. RU_4_3]|nr:HEAT repeat domain-containing protein [Alkalinema sp. RU_4_3]